MRGVDFGSMSISSGPELRRVGVYRIGAFLKSARTVQNARRTRIIPTYSVRYEPIGCSQDDTG